MTASDESRLAAAQAWFVKVHHDLRSAAALLRAKPAITDAALFHCQQAVEKALKGYLHWHGCQVPKTHNLVQLGKMCTALDGSIELVTFRTVFLTRHAVSQRYPGEGPEPTLRETRKALRLAQELVAAILDRLPRSVRPRGIRL